jgi:hypothetical protein
MLNVTAFCVRIYREALRLSSFKLSCNSVGIIFVVDGTKSHSCPITGLERPVGLQEVEVARISRQWTYTKVARLSAVRIGRLYLSSTLPRVRSQVLISVRG